MLEESEAREVMAVAEVRMLEEVYVAVLVAKTRALEQCECRATEDMRQTRNQFRSGKLEVECVS